MIAPMFIAHGSPMVAIEDTDYARFLDGLASILPQPKAIVIFSAHWESSVQKVSQVEAYSTIYDFGGFPDELFQVKYPAVGDVALSLRIQDLLSQQGIEFEVEKGRGLDHGAWTILHRIYPQAQIPVVAMSVNARLTPVEQYRIGEALAPLCADDVLVIGSGVTVHNFGLFQVRDNPEVHAAVRAFEGWLEDNLQAWDTDALFDYANAAPNANIAVPQGGEEHFVPLFYAMGAAGGAHGGAHGGTDYQRPQVTTLHRSYLYNVMTNTVFQMGNT